MRKAHFLLRLTFVSLTCALLGCGGDDGGSDSGSGGSAGTAAGAAGVAGVAAGSAGTAGAAGTAGTAGTAGMAGMAGTGEPGMPTWTAIYNDIIVNTGCTAGALCHGGAAAGSMLPMGSLDEAYSSLVGVAAKGMNLIGTAAHCKDSGLTRVVAGDPTMSLLMQKLDGMQTCGTEMPPGGLLTEAQRAQIRMWILDGAQKN